MTVDLSLPTDAELRSAASPHPEVAAARVTRTGQPGQVRGIGQQLMAAGMDLDQVHEHSKRAQRVLAGSFTNDGRPVYDEAVHRRQLPAEFGEAGTRLHDTGRRLLAVAEELQSAITDVTGSLERLRVDLSGRRSAFAAEVDAARGAGGLVPIEAVPALQARRAVVAGQLQEAVSACGREVAARLGRYDEVLNGCVRLLGEFGSSTDARGTRLAPILGGGLAGSSPAPPGQPAEILPRLEHAPPDRGFTPAPAGPGPLITVPGPDLGTAVQGGPGSGQGADGGPIIFDRDAPADPPSSARTPTDRLKEQVDDPTLDAARREADGEIVARRPDGEPYDHVTKVRQGQRGLMNRIAELKRLLGDSRVPQSERRALESELSEASRLLDHTENFVPRS